jgi:hypothetical protein
VTPVAGSRSVRLALRALVRLVLALSVVGTARPSRAEPGSFRDTDVLAPEPAARVELVQTRITAYEQRGRGYQSQEGPLAGPGSETLHVLQVQGELVVHQGDRLTHRLWVPVDVVTSASANASDRYYSKPPDVISRASAQNVAKEIDYELSARADRHTTWTGGVGGHHEENFGSWQYSLEYRRALAEDNATVSVAANQVLDWFDAFRLGGHRAGRATRSSSNLNFALTQLLSESTLVSVGYGVTLQRGELSNTWNSVPTSDGGRVREALPRGRLRQATSIALAQWLPWQGALRLRYRLYRDDWSVTAHSIDASLSQRAFGWLVLGLSGRHHHQTAVSFFTIRSPPLAVHRTADSDLADLSADSLGGSATATLPTAALGTLFLSAGFEHYFRSDALYVNVATWASGFRF